MSGVINAHIAEHDLPIPADIKLSLRALNIRHKAAASARHETLRLICEAFSKNKLNFVALKGVALLPRLYGKPELRPMRDMDLLVPLHQQSEAADCLRAIGFDLPHEQPSRFMRYVHQLPNATLQVNGFTCSVEIHNNAFSSDVGGKLRYPVLSSQRQMLEFDGLSFEAFDDITMLHQVCRHLEGLHPGGVLKLINVMDVIGLACEIDRSGAWSELSSRYPHVLITLRCLNMLTPLPDSLLSRLSMPHDRNLSGRAEKSISGVGQIMESLTEVLVGRHTIRRRLELLFSPSDWWLHLHYNVAPDKSIWPTKLVRHPWRVFMAFVQRAWSALLGG